MNRDDDQLGGEIERERREIASLQQRVRHLVLRNEGPAKEKRDGDLKKLRHDISAAGNGRR